VNGYVKNINKDSLVFGSVAWANDTLRWIIEFLKEDSWRDRLYLKVIVARSVAEDLRVRGYPWQSRRCLNQLYLFLKKQKLDVSVNVSCKIEDFDTLSEREESS
jgi:hypothetical protein